MGNVDKVFAQIETRALTPQEISYRSGFSVEKVRKVLDFLEDFDFVKKEGPKYRVTDEVAALP